MYLQARYGIGVPQARQIALLSDLPVVPDSILEVQVAVNVHLVLVLVDVGQVYDLGELIGVEHPILP